MKTNKETIKNYLEQKKNHGNSQNVFYSYDIIYSYGYHYILGKFIKDDILIINDNGYSNTTSKHIHLLRDTANEMNIINYNISNVELNSVYNQIKYLESKLHKARKPKIWYNAINNLYKKWFDFTQKYGTLIMSKNDIKFSNIAKHSEKSKEILKISLRVEQYYTSLILDMN